MRLNNWNKAILATLVAQIVWGVAAPLVKIGLYHIPPFSFLFLRSLGTVLLLFPIYEFSLLPNAPKLTPLEIKKILLAAVTGVFLNLVFYFMGQVKTTVIDAFILISMGTPIVLLLSFFRGERLRNIVYFGVGLSLAGSLVIIGAPILNFGQGSPIGNLFIFAAALMAALSYLLIKDLITKVSPLLLTYYFFFISLILSLPLFIYEFIKDPTWMAQLTSIDYLVLLFSILGSSIIAYYLSNYGLKYLPASLAATLGYSSVIVSITLSVIFLGERPTQTFTLGAILIVIGLVLAETRHRKRS